MNYLIETLIVGVVATAVMDVWGVVRKPLLGLPAADYRLVGRWIAYFARGKFRHESIAKAPALSLEQLIGWAAHYLLGMVFAAGLLAVTRPGWIQRPTLGPALIFGVLTVAVPFLVMQPAFGAGIAASRMPRPNAVRLQSLLTHLVFGFGLFVGGWAAHLFYSTGD